MKREEIEELITEYVTGEISPERGQQLHFLFESDPLIKQEAEEMLSAWQALNNTGKEFDKAEDAKFYQMLDDAKQQNKPAAKVIRLNWLMNVAAAVILVALAFIIGRQTAPVKTTAITKTVLIKQPALPAQVITKVIYEPPVVKAPVVHKAMAKAVEKAAPQVNDTLNVQLRSVYASERLAAIMSIAKKPQLTPADLKQLELVLKEDPSPNVRLATIDLLRPLAKQQNIQNVLAGAFNEQDNGAVQASIVDILLDNHSTQIKTLTRNRNITAAVQEKIMAGIENL